jgi:hypothetical protein
MYITDLVHDLEFIYERYGDLPIRDITIGIEEIGYNMGEIYEVIIKESRIEVR